MAVDDTTPRSGLVDKPVQGGDLLRGAYGDTLRKWRALRGNLDQAALSRKAGLPHYVVGSLERGERAINLKEIVKLCRALELEVDLFLQDAYRGLLVAVQPVQGLTASSAPDDELRRAADLLPEGRECLPDG